MFLGSLHQRVRQAHDQSLLTLWTIGLTGNAVPTTLGTCTTAARQHRRLPLTRRQPQAVHAKPPPTRVPGFSARTRPATTNATPFLLLRLLGTPVVIDS